MGVSRTAELQPASPAVWRFPPAFEWLWKVDRVVTVVAALPGGLSLTPLGAARFASVVVDDSRVVAVYFVDSFGGNDLVHHR